MDKSEEEMAGSMSRGRSHSEPTRPHAPGRDVLGFDWSSLVSAAAIPAGQAAGQVAQMQSQQVYNDSATVARVQSALGLQPDGQYNTATASAVAQYNASNGISGNQITGRTLQTLFGGQSVVGSRVLRQPAQVTTWNPPRVDRVDPYERVGAASTSAIVDFLKQKRWGVPTWGWSLGLGAAVTYWLVRR